MSVIIKSLLVSHISSASPSAKGIYLSGSLPIVESKKFFFVAVKTDYEEHKITLTSSEPPSIRQDFIVYFFE